jgi:membrane protein
MPLLHRVSSATWQVVRDTFREWFEDNAPMYGAALAFYSIFSLAPLLVIAIAVAGLAFGREAVQGHVLAQFSDLLGTQGARQVEIVLRNAAESPSGPTATVLGVITLFVGATAVFNQLKVALNTIWGVPTQPGAVRSFFVDRLLSFAMVQCIAFLLLISLLVNAALAAAARAVERFVPDMAALLLVAGFVFSLLVVTVLFAAIFKILPDVRIAWMDVWVGALATALLFSLGKFLIGLYLGRSSVASVYGAAGSLVVLLLWVYYSAQVFLLGAEFTQVYARRWGSRILPGRHEVAAGPVSP